MNRISEQAARLRTEWQQNPRWAGTQRTYSAEDVIRLRGSVQEEHTLAKLGAERLWSLLQDEDYVNALGALTGNQAVQQVRAGLKAIYLSGWQVAADANLAAQTYPDQSLYPANSVPQVVRRINNALIRADQITFSESADGDTGSAPYWMAPIVADAEAGFGGVLNAYELMKCMIAAGAAGVHWEDQLASEKKCGHLGGKVLIPTAQHIKTLNAARLAADVCGVPTLVVARTDAHAATLITSDVDERDRRVHHRRAHRRGLLPGAQRHGAVRRPRPGLRPLLRPAVDGDLHAGPGGGAGVRRGDQGGLPGPDAGLQLLAVVQLAPAPGRRHDREVPARAGAMGYKFQFITLAGFHALNYSMFELAPGYAAEGMPAYVELQEAEFAAEARATPPPGTSARSAPATSTWSRRPSPRTPPPSRWPAPPRASSSQRRDLLQVTRRRDPLALAGAGQNPFPSLSLRERVLLCPAKPAGRDRGPGGRAARRERVVLDDRRDVYWSCGGKNVPCWVASGSALSRPVEGPAGTGSPG